MLAIRRCHHRSLVKRQNIKIRVFADTFLARTAIIRNNRTAMRCNDRMTLVGIFLTLDPVFRVAGNAETVSNPVDGSIDGTYRSSKVIVVVPELNRVAN